MGCACIVMGVPLFWGDILAEGRAEEISHLFVLNLILKLWE